MSATRSSKQPDPKSILGHQNAEVQAQIDAIVQLLDKIVTQIEEINASLREIA